MAISQLPTSVPKVWGDSLRAVSLVDQFYSCPAAKEWIASSEEIKPVMVQLSDQIFGAYALVSFKESDEFRSRIFIQASSSDKEALGYLVFELFNTLHKAPLLELDKQARQGELAMDAYALGKEMLEYDTAEKSDALIERCTTEWQIPMTYPEFKGNPIHLLFWQEVTCHTDSYRQGWIDHHQRAYCSKNPQDTRSCGQEIQRDLCDREAVKKLHKEEPVAYNEFIKNRICKVFFAANETTRANRDVIEAAIIPCLPLFSIQSLPLTSKELLSATVTVGLTISLMIFKAFECLQRLRGFAG